jgi:hypothetical protein
MCVSSRAAALGCVADERPTYRLFRMFGLRTLSALAGVGRGGPRRVRFCGWSFVRDIPRELIGAMLVDGGNSLGG